MVFGLFSDAYVQPAECIISVDGEPLEELFPFVSEVVVEATRNCFTKATITFVSTVDETGYWTAADDPRLEKWAGITIEADFQDGVEEILRGVIYRVKPSFPADAGEATLVLECRDNSAKLSREVRFVRWGEEPVGTTDTEILTQIASDHGLRPHPMSGPGQVGAILTQNANDITFLQRRARANGYELLFIGDEIYFGPQRVDLDPQPSIKVHAGKATNAYSFEPDNSGDGGRGVAIAARDDNGNPGQMQTITSNLPPMGDIPASGGGSDLRPLVDALDRASVPSGAETEAYAQGLANENDLAIRATGELDGSLYGHVLTVGETVGVDGVGERHNGIYYVDTVTHTFNTDGYRQAFTLLRNAYGDNLESGGLGALSGVL